MLTYNPKDRPSYKELLNDQIFKNFIPNTAYQFLEKIDVFKNS